MQGFLSKTHAFYNTHAFYATLLHSGALTEEMPGRISFAHLKNERSGHIYTRGFSLRMLYLNHTDMATDACRSGVLARAEKKAEEVFDVRKKDNYEP